MAFTQQDIQKIKETSYNVKQYMINKHGVYTRILRVVQFTVMKNIG